MLEAGDSGELSIALVNAILLALWAVLPGLLFGYIWQWCAVRRTGTTFALRKSEAAELDRALATYVKVRRGIEDIGEQPHGLKRFWCDLVGYSASGNDKREDLQAHAEHLRASIKRLNHLPLRRLKNWLNVRSAQFALGHALAVHVVSFTLILVTVHRVGGLSAWAAGFSTATHNALVWYPFDARLFYANGAATAFAAAAGLLSYVARRVTLRRQRWLDLCIFKDLSITDPNRLADETKARASAQYDQSPGHHTEDCDWPAVLGISHDATIEGIKEAYKMLIKQNHPDRVEGMSTAFKRLAETETKKINAAYRQALAATRSYPLHGIADYDAAA